MKLKQNILKEKNAEFCHNSRRWILFMVINDFYGSCPYKEQKFQHCEDCSYYENKLITKSYLKSVNKFKIGKSPNAD